jgi:site-specific DNA recombinase
VTTLRPAVVDETLQLREYLRVSKGDGGLETSPDEQHDDHVTDGPRNGFTLHPKPYRDIGSASRHATKARTDFDKMLADLKAGQFDADGLAIWEPSRGSRRVWEWALLIDLLADHHLKVWVHTAGRFYDPRNGRDRRTLQEDAVDAEYESSKTSDRTRRSHASRARDGRPVGRVTYGYACVYDERNGKLLGREAEPTKAKQVNDLLFLPFVAGVSQRAIERDWAARGILNGLGKPFTAMQHRDMLRNRTYISERVHIPGKSTRWWKVPADEVEITPGQWPAIVDRDVFFRAQAILDDSSRQSTRPGRAQHFLTMIVRCDKCRGPIVAQFAPRGVLVYKCRDHGCVSISGVDVEEFGEALILAWLADPKVFARAKDADEQNSVALTAAKGELATARARYRSLMKNAKANKISIEAFAELEPQAIQDVKAAKRLVEELETPQVLRGLIRPGKDVAVRWAAIKDITIRRKIAQLVLTPERAGQVRITPSPCKGQRVPVDKRVNVIKKDPDEAP